MSLSIICSGCINLHKQNYRNNSGQSLKNHEDKKQQESISHYGNPLSYEVDGKTYKLVLDTSNFKQQGIASWYGDDFHNKRTSSGEIYDMHQMTAAHKTLPIPVWVKVTNLENGRTTVLWVNDRGPFVDGRIIDLSYAAAKKLDIVEKGTAQVEIEVVNNDLHRNPIKIYLQTGAFSEKNNAEKQQSYLQANSFENISIEEYKNDNRKIHKVLLGPLNSVAESEQKTELLKTFGIDWIKVVLKRSRTTAK